MSQLVLWRSHGCPRPVCRPRPHCHHPCESKYLPGRADRGALQPGALLASPPCIFHLHNRTAYLLVVAIVLHPVVLLFNPTRRFRWVDIVLPVWSPVQPMENTLGAVGLYLVLVVVVTSYFRLRLKWLTWKRFHYLVYVACIAVFAHSLLTDPHLKGLVDFLDGEKLVVELCGALTLAFGIVGVKRKRSRSQELQGASITSRSMTENNRGPEYE